MDAKGCGRGKSFNVQRKLTVARAELRVNEKRSKNGFKKLEMIKIKEPEHLKAFHKQTHRDGRRSDQSTSLVVEKNRFKQPSVLIQINSVHMVHKMRPPPALVAQHRSRMLIQHASKNIVVATAHVDAQEIVFGERGWTHDETTLSPIDVFGQFEYIMDVEVGFDVTVGFHIPAFI